uniref:Uncharacterized protein n=1 Tax=Amphimedon queenslandica TaxID=400682 RepID=A0A1X7SGB3_AMPQE
MSMYISLCLTICCRTTTRANTCVLQETTPSWQKLKSERMLCRHFDIIAIQHLFFLFLFFAKS